jgi:hypothetical protein
VRMSCLLLLIETGYVLILEIVIESFLRVKALVNNSRVLRPTLGSTDYSLCSHVLFLIYSDNVATFLLVIASLVGMFTYLFLIGAFVILIQNDFQG